jgi:ribosomal protein S18 acetylase RimI-like enzyme
MKIDIREATPDDAATIARFNQRIALETEGKTLEKERILAGVSRLLSEPARGRYWLAEVGGAVVGQSMVTYEWSDWRNGNVWWIQSVYVAEEYRRRGIYSALYAAIQDEARNDTDACGIRLYVEKSNERAQATYRALGMEGGTYLVMEAMF